MSKALIGNLINEINAVLSHPVGSVSRRADPEALHQREQLKQLRSHLENLPDDASLGNLEQQFQSLVARLQSQIGTSGKSTQNIATKTETLSMDKSKTDKLEILPPRLVRPSNSNLFDAESDLVMENRPMTNGTPEPNPTFVNDRMIASLQQAIQQTLQQVVKESVQTSVQQVVSQTLAVERALMVGEISANLNKIVEAQQRSQISQELVTLNQQKQKLSSEILQLESDRAAWMQQFQEFQNSQQQSLSHSLRSVDSYLREQITDTLQQAVTNTPPVVVQPAPETELANRVQEQTDRFLLQLDEMFNSTFRSLEQDIQSYQSSIEAKIGYMETLEQKGEALISALVERINQQTDQQPSGLTENSPVDNFADLPEDISPRYLETFVEPADENLINTLLAGNQFGEAIAESVPELTIDTVGRPVLPNDEAYGASNSISPDVDSLAHLDTQPEPQEANLSVENLSIENVTELESILGAGSETLFEDFSEQDSVIHDYRSAAIAHTLNPDFDAEAATQIVESFDFPQSDLDIDEIAEAIKMADFASLDLSSSPASETFHEISDEILEITQDRAIDDPELLRWLEESHDRPIPINLAEVSADEELMSWLGNDAIDMAKLPESSQSQDPKEVSSLSELEIALDLETSPILETREITTDKDIEKQIDQFFSEPNSDQVDDSDESLILLASNDSEDSGFPNWEDSLVKELNSDLARLETGVSNDPMIAANLDQFIRNTPYSLTNWEVEESQNYPTIIDVAAQTSDLRQTSTSPLIAPSTPIDQNIPPIIENPDLLFIDRFAESFEDAETNALEEARAFHPSEQTEVVIDFMDSQSSPFATSSSEIPDIFENTDGLFESSQDLTDAGNQGNNRGDRDDMDAIFAEVIAENAAKYAQTTPFETQDELEELFVRASDTIITEATVSEINQKISIEEDESDLDTLLYGFDPDSNQNLQEFDTLMQVPIPHSYGEIDSGAETFRDSIQFAEPIEFIEELDTILQGYVKPESINFDASAETSFAEFESLPTVIEQPSSIEINVSQPEESWSDALDQLESALSQPIESDLDVPLSIDLSADEFFASLEYDKLNSFADNGDPSGEANRSSYDLADELDQHLVSQADEDEEELLLNKFADAQTDDQSGKAQDSDWENLLSDLNAFSFREPLLDDQREQLGLSSIAPITDSLESVLDIDSLVVESQRTALIPPPIEKEVYSLDDHWILGIDFGASGLRASLLNGNSGKVYLLSLDGTEELPCKLAWSANQNLDDPISSDIRVLTKKSQSSGRSSDRDLDQGEVSIYQFKQFLKIGLPYRGVSSWQPIVQWSNSHQVSLRWLIAALKTLLEQIQTRAENPHLPDLGLILLKLSGVVFGYPSNWSDTYILNVREAILKADLVKQAEQVMAVEQTIAPLLSLIHERRISPDITVLIDVGAVSTSLCLAKGITDLKAMIANQSQDYLAKEQASQRSKLQMLSFDYAGINISQDIIVHLFYPHWQLITNPNRHLCKFDHLSLPEVGMAATAQRILLHQYLLSSEVGQQMLELADRVKVMFGQDVHLDTWNEELMGQPLVVLRRELENLILQPFIQRINRELNTIFSNAGILGDDVSQVFLIGNTMQIPLLSRWITQKLPNVKIKSLDSSAIATGLAVSPLYPALHNVARQQYSDYFLLQEICRLNLTKSITPSQLLQQLQMRGINIKVCRDRILTILQGDLPAGLFPWHEPEQSMVLEDPTLSNELYAGKLFELETDGTYEPNVTKFQQLRVYLQAITGNMNQTLNEPLVFPELVKSRSPI